MPDRFYRGRQVSAGASCGGVHLLSTARGCAHRGHRPAGLVSVHTSGMVNGWHHRNGNARTRRGGLASHARCGERTWALRRPPPYPAGGEARHTPAGSDKLWSGEMLSGGPGVWGTGRPLPRERRTPRQQLGRAMDRDWAGSTGRTGWSNAGKRLANFFIGRFLIASNRHRNSRQTSRRASIADRPAKSRQTALHDVPSWIWPSRLATCTAVQPGHLAQLAPHPLSRQTVLCERRTYPTESVLTRAVPRSSAT
jgi:hypothetical protein